MIETIRQGLAAEGMTVSLSQLCRWCEVSRRTVYYAPVKTSPVVHTRFAEPIKARIKDQPSCGKALIVPLSRRYARGQFTVPNGGTLVVSCGVRCSTLPFRTFFPPDIIVCEFTGSASVPD
jgi:hypothetical protein